jgi:stress-induced morphogen
MESKDAIVRKLQASFAPTHLEVDDVSNGCGARFDIIVVSDTFDGVALLDRHKQVNAVIADELKAIHAVTLKTWTPAQFSQKQAAK